MAFSLYRSIFTIASAYNCDAIIWAIGTIANNMLAITRVER